MSIEPWRIERFAEIDSTNTWLCAQAREGAPEGLVAVTNFQSAGRGRRDRTWSAPPGSALLTSFLLRPDLESLEEAQLAVAAVALSVRDALVARGVEPRVKWPNDLLLGERKLSGVLAELVLDGGQPAVVVGVGVNLSAAPEGAACVADAGVQLSADELLDATIAHLEPRRVLLHSAAGRVELRRQYGEALDTIGRQVRVERDHDVITGVAVGVDETGRLMVDSGDAVVSVAVGDVVHLRAQES